MSCHNERVARTRKHAEAKRSRGARKEKTGDGSVIGGSSSKSSSRSKGEREHRDRDRDREKSKDSQGSNHFDQPDSTSHLPHNQQYSQPPHPSHPPPHPAQFESQIPIRPLPPSPMNGLFANGANDPSSSHRRIKTTPGDAPRHSPSIDLPPSGSAQSLNTLASARSTTPTIHSRTPSSLSSNHPHDSSDPQSSSHHHRPIGQPSLNSLREHSASNSRRPSGEQSYFNDPRGVGSTSPEPPQDAFRPRQYGGDGSLSPQLPLDTSRHGSLSAPSGVDKSANRRSGFYGRPSVSEESTANASRSASIDETASSQISRTPPTTYTPTLPPPTETSPPPSAPPPQQTSFPPSADSGQNLHGSMSFYDPDSLLFLNGIGSTPSSPKNSLDHQKALPSIVADGLMGDEGEEEQEHLDSSSRTPRRHGSGGVRRDDGDSSEEEGEDDERDLGERDPAKSEVARKVRESIQLAKRESEGLGVQSGLDVELVEMLLGELEGTKKEMSDLQSKYNAFRVRLFSCFSIHSSQELMND